jgi:hypothetical protein
MSPATTTFEALPEDERAELARLRAEIAQLRANVPPSEPPSRKVRGHWGRSTAAAVLIVVACLLAPLAVTAAWASSQVSDTDRYVETVATLADDPAIQAAITANITAEIFNRIDVDAFTADAMSALEAELPTDSPIPLTALSRPLADGIRGFVGDTVGRVVASDVFAQAWAEANRVAHDQLVALLSGDQTRALAVEGQSVVVDLSVFAERVKSELVDRGFALANRIPEMNTQVVVFESKDLPKIQRGYDLLNTIGLWLGPVCLIMVGLGVYAAANHRRAAVTAGLGVAVAMLVAGLLLAFARSAYLDAVPPNRLPPDAAAVLFDTLVRFLREVIRAVGLFGLVFAAGAFLTGPAVTSSRVRALSRRSAAAMSRGINGLGVGLEGVRRVVGTRTTLWRAGLVMVAIALFVIPAYPTPMLVLGLVALVLVGLLIIQVLATPTSEGAAPPAASTV